MIRVKSKKAVEKVIAFSTIAVLTATVSIAGFTSRAASDDSSLLSSASEQSSSEQTESDNAAQSASQETDFSSQAISSESDASVQETTLDTEVQESGDSSSIENSSAIAGSSESDSSDSASSMDTIEEQENESDISVVSDTILELTDEDVDFYYYGWHSTKVEKYSVYITGLFDGDTSAGPYLNGSAVSSDVYLIIDLKEEISISGINITLKEGYNRLGYTNAYTTAGWSIYALNEEDFSYDESDWKVLWSTTGDDQESLNYVTDDSIQVQLEDKSCRYLMIGANASFLNSWVHTWDQFSELSIYGVRVDVEDSDETLTDWHEIYDWDSVIVDTKSVSLEGGESQIISYFLPSEENVSITFVSDDESTAKVDDSGVITAISSGTARVYISIVYEDHETTEYGNYLINVTVR
jgi:hypothetical protein